MVDAAAAETDTRSVRFDCDCDDCVCSLSIARGGAGLKTVGLEVGVKLKPIVTTLLMRGIPYLCNQAIQA